MDDILQNVIYTTVQFFSIALLVAIIIAALHSQEKTNAIAEQKINQKHNVSQAYRSEEDESNLLAMSSVLYAIKTVPEEVIVSINYHELSAEDRENLKEFNDATEILSYLNASFNYKAEYIYDQNGQLQQLNYKSIY